MIDIFVESNIELSILNIPFTLGCLNISVKHCF